MIFVDTGFFFAFFSANDPDHARCRAVFETFKGRPLHELFLTTDHVVFETLTLTRSRIGHDRAVFVGERLYSEKMARIHQASFDEQRAAFEYFKRYDDKNTRHRSLSDEGSFWVSHPASGVGPARPTCAV